MLFVGTPMEASASYVTSPIQSSDEENVYQPSFTERREPIKYAIKLTENWEG
jgi:hypothetical protein